MNKDPSSKEDCSIILSLQGITSSRPENIMTRVTRKYPPRGQEWRSSAQRRNNSTEQGKSSAQETATSLANISREIRDIIEMEKKVPKQAI